MSVMSHIQNYLKTGLDPNGESLVCRARGAEHERVLVERFKRRVKFDLTVTAGGSPHNSNKRSKGEISTLQRRGPLV
jgi:hypothetical protein